MSNRPDSYVLTPKPPTQAPKGFQDGYFRRRSKKPTCLIGLGALLIFVAASIFGTLGWRSYQEQQDKEATEAARVEATATIVIIGGETLTLPTDSLAPTLTSTPTQLKLSSSTPAGLPTATYTFIPPSPLPPTNTPLPSRTPLPPTIAPSLTSSDTPSITPSLTPSLTLTKTTTPPTVTSTFTATRIPASTTPLPSATPEGRHVRLMYDETSFYVWNMSEEDIPIRNLTFEALDRNGEYADFRLTGSHFARFYHFLEDTKCVAVEITTADSWMRPPACWAYNAVLSPQISYEGVFWLKRQGITEFRVLWRDREIARCSVRENVNECDIYIP